MKELINKPSTNPSGETRSTKISIGCHGNKIKDNAQQIVEQEQAKKRSELMAQEERSRKKDPSRYGGMIRDNRIGTIDVQTPWRNLFETPKTEYDEALENAEDAPGKKYYW